MSKKKQEINDRKPIFDEREKKKAIALQYNEDLEPADLSSVQELVSSKDYQKIIRLEVKKRTFKDI